MQTTLPDAARPVLGPKLATENRRSFSESQLRAGLNELSMQTRGATIERLGVDESASITFGNAKAGTGDTTTATLATKPATIERLPVDESASIVFGYKKSGGDEPDAPPPEEEPPEEPLPLPSLFFRDPPPPPVPLTTSPHQNGA